MLHATGPPHYPTWLWQPQVPCLLFQQVQLLMHPQLSMQPPPVEPSPIPASQPQAFAQQHGRQATHFPHHLLLIPEHSGQLAVCAVMATATRLTSLVEATDDLWSGPWKTQTAGLKLPLLEASFWQLNAG